MRRKLPYGHDFLEFMRCRVVTVVPWSKTTLIMTLHSGWHFLKRKRFSFSKGKYIIWLSFLRISIRSNNNTNFSIPRWSGWHFLKREYLRGNTLYSKSFLRISLRLNNKTTTHISIFCATVDDIFSKGNGDGKFYYMANHFREFLSDKTNNFYQIKQSKNSHHCALQLMTVFSKGVRISAFCSLQWMTSTERGQRDYYSGTSILLYSAWHLW